MKKFFKLLNRDLNSNRYTLFVRAQFLVLAGYTITITETFIAIYLGLTPITYGQTISISISVLGISLTLLIITLMIKRIKFWHELIIFGMYVVMYLVFFTIWVYHLQQLRILGIVSILLAVTIVISYTTLVQSLFMSLLSLACVLGSIYYSIQTGEHPASYYYNDIFVVFCFIPAVILVSLAAYYLNYRRKEVVRAKNELELLNICLSDANALLQEEQRITRIEMELAHKIQSGFFPSLAPDTENWDVAFFTTPSSGVSGDFYDFYYSGNRLQGISLFDVSGHGVASALVTILARPVFYRNFRSMSGDELGRVFSGSNLDLYTLLEQVHLFITGIMLRFDGDKIEYINAGHPDIMIREKVNGAVLTAGPGDDVFKGHPIGISRESGGYTTHTFSLNSGDVILLYSDGVIDCRNPFGEYYGRKSLRESLASCGDYTAREILESLVKGFQDFTAGCPIPDDITLIVARKK